MTLPIRRPDLVDSVARALQHISHTHPADFLAHLAEAHAREASPAARNAMTQILLNSRMAATDRRPICQDTGIVNVLLEVGMDARWSGFDDGLEDAVNEGVRLAYRHPDNPLRASVVSDPLFGRPNTRDNTPAVIHARVVPGDTLTVTVAAKGGGSENKARLAMLNPGDSVVDWVLRTVPELGAGWCPPGILGIGVGGTAEKAMQLAKESLMEPLDMLSLRTALRAGRKLTPEQALRVELHERVNALGIGAQGLGGLSTVLDVKLHGRPSHARAAANARSTLASRTLLPPHAHRRIQDLLARGEPMPVDFAGRVIYYVGPVDPVRNEAVGPAGPTTSTRMDGYTEMMLAQGGLLAMVGKAERGPEAVAAIRRHRAAYLIAVGGAAYLVSQAIRGARVVAFEDLGMEAIYEFDVVDMPVTVAVDAQGGNVHEDGPARWRRAPAGAIGGIAIRGA